MLEVWTADCGCLRNPQLFLEQLQKVSETRRLKVEQNKTDGGKRQSLAAGLLLRHMLAEVGLAQENVLVKNGRYGKPYLCRTDGTEYPIYINLSHSGDWVAGALSDTEVGIDVERLKTFRAGVARRFFTEAECEYIGENQKKFFAVWTLKEAFVKTLGGGISIPLMDFEVLGALSNPWAEARWLKSPAEFLEEDAVTAAVYLKSFPNIKTTVIEMPEDIAGRDGKADVQGRAGEREEEYALAVGVRRIPGSVGREMQDAAVRIKKLDLTQKNL